MEQVNIDNIIETESLTKVFGDLTAVSGVTLKVAKGDIWGLVGPDGAGKTTLMRMFCGLIEPNSGRITRTGDSFGYMPQKFSFYGDLTVAENINFFGALYKIDSKTIRRRSDEILEITDLAGFKSRFADDLSGGMKQKLALTCALLARPALLILDEPTYGVDPESRKEFWKILYELNKEGVTIVVSTPYMDEAELCKKVALMSRGIIMSTGDPGSLKKSFPYGILELKASARDLDFINDLPEVVDGDFYGDKYHVAVYDVEQAKAAIINLLSEKKVAIHYIRQIPPSMEDVFVAMTKEEVV
ncbi:MAG: putative ABC transporter ATP-binding protein YbhF [Pelotomaculum sp. PtaB.Bin013]|nr:MAG: putative ABC transporter ATP-binding protein YbhF [Pelotomaculum sp. PtaB.Bin013]